MKKEYFYYLLITLAFVIMATFNACKPEPEPEPQTPGSVKVTTSSVSNITETSAKCGGTVTASGYSVGSCGLCYSELPNPTINSYITSDQVGTGTFTSTMSGLEPGTKYYVRAYATNEKGTSYGEQKSFTTLDDPTIGTINGYEYVDLGLPSGLKWATCNVGASSPEQHGDYYAWGETETKSTYTIENSITYGVEMSDISGDPQYDVARKKWGSTWRMPTKDEMRELDKCKRENNIVINGIKGMKLTGPNGRFIFFPYNEIIDHTLKCWTSTPNTYIGTPHSRACVIDEVLLGIADFSISRYCGCGVRPVSE